MPRHPCATHLDGLRNRVDVDARAHILCVPQLVGSRFSEIEDLVRRGEPRPDVDVVKRLPVAAEMKRQRKEDEGGRR